jgi:hypothetical protein
MRSDRFEHATASQDLADVHEVDLDSEALYGRFEPPVPALLDSDARPRCISPVLGRCRAPTSWRSPIAPASPDSHTLHALSWSA